MKQAIQLKENMYWVGVHDFNCRHFHGDLFPISEGTTYNSYLIVDEQITLIDGAHSFHHWGQTNR